MNSFSAEPSEPYLRAVAFLYDRINHERTTDRPYNRDNFRLSRMERLLVELDNPQQAAPVVHIAGSKGKGSVAWLTAESLRHAGYRVGLYTSPHLAALEERFVLNGTQIKPDDFVRAVEAVRPAAESIAEQGHGHATFFELTTAMAWWMFRAAAVDVNVIEVGLGGRLDSTNVCWPALSIITSISYDHQAQLGDTLGQIAFEKAGIIKPGVPVVSGATNPEASEVIRRVAGERGSMLRELDRDFAAKPNTFRHDPSASRATDSLGTTFDYVPSLERWPTGTEYRRLDLRLLGRHQVANATLTVAGLDILREHGRIIPEQAVRSALRTTRIPGRIQIISERPLIILDTAHNEASIAALVQTLEDHFPPMKRTFVFSSSRDKKWREMLKQLLPAGDRFILTRFQHNPRAVPVEALHEAMQELAETAAVEVEILAADTPTQAFALAKQKAGSAEMIVVAGSFFLAAEVLEAIHGA